MIDHQLGHSAVDTDILTGDKSRLVRTQEKDRVGDVERVADPADGLLLGVGTVVRAVRRVDPPGRDRIDPDDPRQTDGERVRERSIPPFAAV